MKILKVFGIVVGIHVFALILIFANPGCSSTTKPAPTPAESVAQEPAPTISVPSSAFAAPSPAPAATTVAFNPDAPATYGSMLDTSRFVPTRPNTPAASAVTAQPPENITPATTYTVKQGDSLWTLQKKFHINYKDIASANNLKTGATLHEGQKLIIPSRTAAAPTTAAAAAPVAADAKAQPKPEAAAPTKGNGQDFKYTVKPGETLGAIAQKFDVKVRDIAVRNNIGDPQKVRAGTELTIPGWKATSAKAGSRSSTEASSAGPSSHASAAAAPAPAPAAPAPVPSIQLEPDQPATTTSNGVPVIRIDDSPSTTAP